MKCNTIKIGGRIIGEEFPPFIIPEIGINHNGDIVKAKKMIHDAYKSGSECVKMQCHIPDKEMIPNNIVPVNADESIWSIISRCSFTYEQEVELKKYTESLGMIFLSTPFSIEAAYRLDEMGVEAYKIGSGECNNYPLIEAIASFGKPIILSTGMNDISSISKAVELLESASVEYALLHVTSLYPTPYDKVRLNVIKRLKKLFPKAVVGLSDHSIGTYTCFASISLGAAIIEKHFTSDSEWLGPDIEISIGPDALSDLIVGSKAVFQAMQGEEISLQEEDVTASFAYASVVSTKCISPDDIFTKENIWVKRPGDGEIKAEMLDKVLGKKAKCHIKEDQQIAWEMVDAVNDDS
jgi:sialic acid synthase SpsE